MLPDTVARIRPRENHLLVGALPGCRPSGSPPAASLSGGRLLCGDPESAE